MKRDLTDLPAVRLISPSGAARDFYQTSDTPQDHFLKLKLVCETYAAQGDTVRFSGHPIAGEFDQLDLSRLAYFGGYGRGTSRLTMTAQHDAADDPNTEVKPDKPARVAILMSGTTTVEHCTLENVPTNHVEDGALIGFPQAGAHSGTIRDVTLIGQDWTFYHWAAAREGSKLLVEDCDVFFARQAFSQCGNNAHDSRWTLRRVKFHGDANGSKSIGSSSGTSEKCVGGLLGVVFRCGQLDMDDCTFVEMRGLDKDYSEEFGSPRVVCITDTYSTAANKATLIRHRGTRFCDLVAGTATDVKFVDMNYGKIEEWRYGEWK